MNKVLIVSLSLFTLLLMMGCQPKVSMDPSKSYFLTSRNPPHNWQEYPDIEAIDLFTKYKENKETAALEYDDKYFTITGVLEATGEDENGQPYVVLGKEDGDGINAVTCIFPRNDIVVISKMKVGYDYSVFGRVQDYLINVIVYDCYLVK